MLSRVADAVFWVNRYIERAENVARFVDVSQSLSLGGIPQWDALVFASGDEELFKELYGECTASNVLQFLLFYEKNSNSILSCLIKARENARTIREVLSVSLWESINHFYLRVREFAKNPGPVLQNPATFLERVKRSSHEVIGVNEATMSHGEAWSFGRIGRLIERADKTSRILDVKYFILLPNEARVGSALDVLQWSALLESTSALHMYRKRFGRIVPRSVADFLILDPHFPRSMHFCVAYTRTALYKITGRQLGHPLAPSEKLCEELHQRLQRLSIHDIIQIGMHEFIDNFQGRLNALGESIRHDFFETREIEALPSEQ
ncbi:MAG: alpha-E domain-containing protein [Planctomycetota bacterium]|nr:MAG: alpha-E domain-containing protein [Planctomycetota bacterium]